jgi:ferredoxin
MSFTGRIDQSNFNYIRKQKTTQKDKFKMVRVAINGITIEAVPGQTILQTCIDKNIEVPHLCWHPDLEPKAKCRICVVFCFLM